jgi:hypothetical protein
MAFEAERASIRDYVARGGTYLSRSDAAGKLSYIATGTHGRWLLQGDHTVTVDGRIVGSIHKVSARKWTFNERGM